MKVQLLPSATDGGQHYLTTFLVDGAIAIDAGSLGLYGEPTEQARVADVFLTHPHADHIGSLPIFVENAYESRATGVTVRGNAFTIDCLQRDVFNGRVWPDLLALSAPAAPFLVLETLRDEEAVLVGDHRVTPVPVDHAVPTYGYVVERDGCAVVFSGDTGPTERLWHVVRGTPTVRAVFLECSFPNEMEELARISKHQTPSGFAAELEKLPRDLPVVAVHIKARYREQTIEQLRAIGDDRIQIGESGREYVFCQ